MLTRLICGDHFTIYTNLEPLCGSPETNYVNINYISINKKHSGSKSCDLKPLYNNSAFLFISGSLGT